MEIGEVSYWYEGRCPQMGEWLRLPRTPEVEAIARSLMQTLADDKTYAREGKMYGVLLVENALGERRILKAFSGLLDGVSHVEGWVPPIPGREQVVVEETHTLAQLDALKQELITLQDCPRQQQYEVLNQEFETQRKQLAQYHCQRQQERQSKREYFSRNLTEGALAAALEQLNSQSRQDSIERRRFNQTRDAVLRPLNAVLEGIEIRKQEIRQQRKQLSRQLQAQMFDAYSLANFAGQVRSLQSLFPNGLPTGTGDCCAPKLLHYAATQQLKPLAMAEFWWGEPSQNGDKIPGEFYGACAERCQPLMGFLLSGISQPVVKSLPIVYQDEWIIVVDKPSGLLSVPGRYGDRQDSVLTRLRLRFPDDHFSTAHRLDQDTSGLLVLAKDAQSYRHLQQQFQTHQVHKIYEAVLSGIVEPAAGLIDLPLWSDPSDRPYQKVDRQRGKPSVTHYQVINRTVTTTRVEFVPQTGRTHQLRVHAAHPEGLGVPILGDRLYGNPAAAARLHLHAREITIQHPHSHDPLHLTTPTPF